MKIKVHDHQVEVRIGCTEEERAFPQIVKLQLQLDIQSETSLKSDELSDTLDYMQLIELANGVAQQREFKLLEHLIGAIGESALELSPLIEAITIQATKQIAVTTSGVSVEATIERGD